MMMAAVAAMGGWGVIFTERHDEKGKAGIRNLESQTAEEVEEVEGTADMKKERSVSSSS